ncbi:protein-disulfide reductase DsbD family protein [Motilimonas sp. 1_MG-2023]|uniref:protein-disulfide reductase DsbD family protein n=1 Tax=Motilimonas sp. 1_MG-2023 TaxID=3062672 RepID=UPI0026E1DE6C|nr:protein-disulfide reductase DsbD domain-containing protein [Motilimonas sp. 1_MG-2023]MDO6527462.1 protein-disulfide reductase DsbD family protein [Motilimonas sp. 1_MG-2023]
MKYRLFTLVGLCLSLFCSFSLAAASTGWLTNPQHPPIQVKLTLTGEKDIVNQTIAAILQVKLSGDWKTYWRAPGEGGIAPSVDWQQSSNVKQVDWFWPVPERFSTLGLETLGYRDSVTFPLQIQLAQLDRNTQLRGKFTLSSCTNVCVLTDYELALDFNATDLTGDSNAMYLYNKAMVQVPQTEQQLAQLSQLTWDQNQQQLSFTITGKTWDNPDVFIIGDPDTYFNIEQLQPEQEQLKGLISVKGWLGEVNLEQQLLTLVVADKELAIEVNQLAQAGIIDANAFKQNPIGWPSMLLIALLGGLILNIMPCVLPVLGMKLSTVLTAKNQSQGQIRKQFIASAFGIISSFWLLALAVLLLKVSGQSIGWGIQFQQPWFIGFMALITTLFALNMLGLFEIQLPSALQTKLATSGGHSYVGHYVQGMFATLLATPCSAPFLGTAVAFALGADTYSLFIIFTALGVGMALPWLLIAMAPQLARYLPRPGNWMQQIKVFFSVLLFATSVWLISLLQSFIGGWLWVIYGIFAIALCCLIKQKYGTKIALICISVSFIGLGAIGITASLTSDRWASPLNPDLAWHMLEQQDIDQQVAQGKTVFVDITADWCITCKANKVGVLLQQPVYDALQQPNIYLMKGDWTKPAPHISDYLQQNDRYGVPFNIVYGPNAPEGIALPVILNSEDVISAIDRASATSSTQ